MIDPREKEHFQQALDSIFEAFWHQIESDPATQDATELEWHLEVRCGGRAYNHQWQIIRELLNYRKDQFQQALDDVFDALWRKIASEQKLEEVTEFNWRLEVTFDGKTYKYQWKIGRDQLNYTSVGANFTFWVDEDE